MITNSEFSKRVKEAASNQEMVEIPDSLLKHVAGGPPTFRDFSDFEDLAGGPGTEVPGDPPGEYPQPEFYRMA